MIQRFNIAPSGNNIGLLCPLIYFLTTSLVTVQETCRNDNSVESQNEIS